MIECFFFSEVGNQWLLQTIHGQQSNILSAWCPAAVGMISGICGQVSFSYWEETGTENGKGKSKSFSN